MNWYQNSAIVGLLGVALGAILGFASTIVTSLINLKAIDKNNNFELEKENAVKRNAICEKMIQSIYSLQRMNDGLIEVDLPKFKDDSYVIMADAKIYCSSSVCALYERFLKEFFEKQLYNGQFVENALLPTIRKDLGIEE